MSKKMLIIIIAVFFLMMGMMGGGFFLMWKQMSLTVAQVQQNGGQDKQDEEAAPQEEEVTIGPLYKLDTIIVNLADHGGKRYLRVTMEMELKPVEGVEPLDFTDEIDRRLPQLRDTILMILPSKQYAEISTTAGKIALRDEIMAQLNGFLKKGTDHHHLFYRIRCPVAELPMSEKILSQEEIDALLNAMDSGEVEMDEKEDNASKAEAKPYDLTSQSLMLRDQFDALDEVYDKFINLLNVSMGRLTSARHRG
jgi:flagellar FliL protein